MNIIEAWFKKAVEDLQVGEELYLECESKHEAITKRKIALKIKEKYESIDPIAASMIEIATAYRLKKFWLMFRKRTNSPLVGFKKGIDGVTRRAFLNSDLSRDRRIKLMLADGMLLSEVEEIEGGLTESEKELFK